MVRTTCWRNSAIHGKNSRCARWHAPPVVPVQRKAAVVSGRQDERGEVLPVAILFVGVLFTILIGLHVVLMSMGRTAVRSAADRGVIAAQQALPGESSCDEVATDVGSVTPTTERECRGVIAVSQAMRASGSMVAQARLPVVTVDEQAGVVSVSAFGQVISPVLGNIEVAARACGPLDVVEGGGPTRADASAC